MPRPLGSKLAELLALVLLSSGGARAEPAAQLALQWSAPAECTQPAGMEAEILGLLPQGLERARAPAFEVRIEALPDGGYRLQLHEAGEDVISARVLRTCAEAAEAAAVLIAMALDANEPAAAAAPAPPPEPPQDGPRDDAAPLPDEHERARAAWTLMAAALGDVRSLPDPSVGAMLGAVWSMRALRLAWFGRYLPAQSADRPPPGTSARIDLYAAALNASLAWKVGALAFGPALELELGYLRGRAAGVQDARSAGAAWAMLAGGALVDVRLHERVSLQFGALLGFPLWRPRFAFTDASPFHTNDGVVLRWFLGVAFRVGPTG